MSDKKDWVDIMGDVIKISSIIRVSKVRKECVGDVTQYSENPINIVFDVELNTGTVVKYEKYSNIFFHNGAYYDVTQPHLTSNGYIPGSYWEADEYKHCLESVSEFRNKLIDKL